MFTEVLSGALTAYEIFERRETIAQIFRRTVRLIISGNAHIGVFGAGGTGKSTLGDFLHGKLDTDTKRADYVETPNIETFKVKGEHPGLLSVAPGQEHRRPGNWDELYNSIGAGNTFRVFNVVSYGHHHTELEKAAISVYKTGMSDEDFIQAWIAYSKDEEIKALREIVPHLKSAPGNLKMITLVTNQDLWWAERHKVRTYYENGLYEKELAPIYEIKGKGGFSHSYISCALVKQNLRTADGLLIAPTAIGYDDALRLANLSKAATVINAMIEK